MECKLPGRLLRRTRPLLPQWADSGSACCGRYPILGGMQWRVGSAASILIITRTAI